MKRKFIFLVNPISGTRSKQSLPDLIKKASEAHAAKVEILPTVASGDYDYVKDHIREKGITDVIICGGDGSVNTIVQQLFEEHVNFGIVPLGSGNGLALSAKIPKQIQAAINLAFVGKASYIDALSINNEFACMLCGIGFDAKVAHEFAQQKTRGLLTYTEQSVKHFFNASPYSFSIEWGEHELNTEAWFISIANSNQFGNNVTIAPQAKLNDGLLDIVVVQKMTKAQLPLSVIGQITMGKPMKNDAEIKKGGILYFQTDKIKIKNIDKAPLHIDGEPKETAKQFDIRVIPSCFKLIQPA